MTAMKHVDFTADGTHVDGAADDSLLVMITGTIGGGTFTVQRYSRSRDAFVTVATYTAVLADADEIRIGKDEKFRFQLSGATTPSLAVDYWFL